jgi:thioester reductase-like protein
MKQKTILITGATGFLGSFITQELLEAGFSLKLLVRKTHDLQAKERVSDVFPLCYPSLFADRTRVGRIEIIEGDVSKKYLGLDTREYIRLAETIDEVFHCAAATKFNDVHNTLTQTNVSGTENVVQFCYTEKIKRLHYISTAYVAGKRRDVVYEDELDKGQAFNNNYEKSKFDTEKLLNQFVRQYDVPATVYRPSIIVGNSRTGYTKNYDNIYIFGKGLYYLKNYKTQKSHENDFSISPKRIHQSSYLRIPGDKYGTINLIPVDYAVRTIIAISRRDESINKIFHIVNPSPPTLGELAE